MKQRICKVWAIILAVTLLACSGCAVRKPESSAKFRITASFYPLYIIAKNIADGIDGVQVNNMAGQQTGCLHDYQLQNRDIKNLEKSDVFLVNGAGMENFLDKVTKQLPNLKIIVASKGISLIPNEPGEEDDDGEAMNPHVWVSITDCIMEVENITQGLMKADPEHSMQYRKNGNIYKSKLSVLREEMHKEIDSLPNRDIITFHEAFPYFAREFNLNIARVVNREPDSQPNAKELAQTIKVIRESGVKAVFAEPQYPQSAANIVAKESGAKMYFLDPAVTGKDDPDAYLNAMRKNMKVLKKALSAN